ncbi:PAS domain-containing protein [Rhodoferax ferrireducens]|uniref:PAS domain-containing protein n=1 Tax=Rhodoferax ferrireducens TaxID=192843 RepID=UPI000A05DDBA
MSRPNLKSDQRWFKQLFESSSNPARIIDGNRFVECNEAAVRMLGYTSRGQFLNVHPSKLSPPNAIRWSRFLRQGRAHDGHCHGQGFAPV